MTFPEMSTGLSRPTAVWTASLAVDLGSTHQSPQVPLESSTNTAIYQVNIDVYARPSYG